MCMKKYDTKAIRDAINIQDVCADFGLRIRLCGKTVYVTCPNSAHTSEQMPGKKPENCAIKNNRLFCYSCGYKADVFQLTATMLFNGNVKDDFVKILEYLQKFCGDLDKYLLYDGDGKYLTKEQKKQIVRSQKRREALSYFGIYNRGIFGTVDVSVLKDAEKNADHFQEPYLTHDDECEYVEKKKLAMAYDVFDEKFIDRMLHQKINDERGRLDVERRELLENYRENPTNLNKEMLIAILRQICVVKEFTYY